MGEFVRSGVRNHYAKGPVFAVTCRFIYNRVMEDHDGWMPHGEAFPITSLLLLLRG